MLFSPTAMFLRVTSTTIRVLMPLATVPSMPSSTYSNMLAYTDHISPERPSLSIDSIHMDRRQVEPVGRLVPFAGESAELATNAIS
jgi:hypothetical protein